MKTSYRVQFGCGLCSPEGWLNYDSSPTLRLQRVPILGSLVPSGPYGRFPASVRYGDIVKGLPLHDNAAELLYCSHVLEHLSLTDLRVALRNCRRVLGPGGTFRLVLPDIEYLAKQYCNDECSEAAIRFMDDTLLGRKTRPRGVGGVVRDWLGNSRHLWMWDYKGLAAELRDAGFTSIRRAAYNDSSFEAFRLVETADRWENALGIECS